MRKRTFLRIGCLGAAAFLSGIITSTAGAAQKVDIKTESGMTVVHNPKNPVPKPGGPSQLILKEELVLGKETGTTGPFFADLRSVGVDDQENIWTLDSSDIKIRVFDKTGKLISTFGKKGQGPKELQGPQRMAVSGDGRAFILDRNKLAVYGRDGSCLEELSTAKFFPFRIKLDKAGYMYLDSMDIVPGKRTNKLTKYDMHLNPIATVCAYDEPLVLGSVNMFPSILYFHVTGDGTLVWAVTSEYRFHVLDRAGKPLRMIVKDLTPLKISADDHKKLIKERFGDQAAQVKIEIPDSYPPIQYFMGDEEGRIYAATYRKDDKGGQWYEVFDPQGLCFTQFSLPSGEMAFIIKNNKLYVLISENEEGIPLVKRYSMEWK